MGSLPHSRKVPPMRMLQTLIMARVCTSPLEDVELRPALESHDTILFIGQTVELKEVERQIERLGFCELYIVSLTKGRNGSVSKINLKPHPHDAQKSGAVYTG